VVSVGLLYQEGCFHQMIDTEGRQLAIYPYNEPSTLPIQPTTTNGEWLRIALNLPGRQLMLRVWQVIVDRVKLHLIMQHLSLTQPVICMKRAQDADAFFPMPLFFYNRPPCPSRLRFFKTCFYGYLYD